MRVTMDLFSGRPNPGWRLTPDESEQLADRLAGEPPLPPLPTERATLGFRGFVVEMDATDRVALGRLPYRFTVGDATVAGRSGLGSFLAGAPTPLSARSVRDPAADADDARWLMGTAKFEVPDEVRSAVEEALAGTARRTHLAASTAPGTEATEEPAGQPALDVAGCRPWLLPIRLGFWNSLPIQPYNNCYNYAANYASNTLAQPGRRSQSPYAAFDCEAVAAAATADGCRPTCDDAVRVLALAVWPGWDFHWWRLHPNGMWAHKVGWNSATVRDNAGRVIAGGLTPQTCDRGPYSDFCGYFYAPLDMWVL